MNMDNQNKIIKAKDLSKLEGICMASMNVRSLFSHLDKIEILLNQLEINILSLQETFLDNSVATSIIELDGYYLYH